MIKYLRLIYLSVFIGVLGVVSSVSAQDVEYTPEQGLEFFNAHKYKEAELIYHKLLEKYPKDARYNYYMGICELINRSNLSGAIKKLNYAAIKNVSRDVYYYLGRAHHLSYHFEEAISNYKKFKQYASKDDFRGEKADLYMTQCNDGRKISSKIYSLEVLDKIKVNQSELLDVYKPAKDVGKLYKNGDFFASGVNPEHIMFETERGDVVYFSMEASSQDTLNIYKMVKLIDGWGDSESVGEPVNSSYNDAYPFLQTDGVTFYFASDRPGGFGGFDIYKTFYDNETHSFLEPMNLGVPFNSPDDDFLFVSDEFNQKAWFASARETSGDEVMVYSIRWDGTQVRNMVEEDGEILQSAMLKVAGEDSPDETDDNDVAYGSGVKNKKEKAMFHFEINDTISYSQYEHFIDSEALKLFKSGTQLEQQKDSLSLLMKSKRHDYSVVDDATQRNKIVNDILRLENQVYSLDDQIQEKYLYARQKELNTIVNQVNKGVYQASRQVQTEKPAELSIEGIFIPEKYAMYSSDEFEHQYAKHDKIYKQLFSENDVKSLKYADSLYVWANVLNLESSQLLAKSNQVEEEHTLKLSALTKGKDSLKSQEEESVASKMIKESKELKILSTRIYHKSMDKKYPIYWLKLKDVSSRLDEEKGKEVDELIYQGNAYFREAKNLLSSLNALNLESFEKAGAMKRAGIESQENALALYCSLLDEGYLSAEKQETTPKEQVQKSAEDLDKSEEGIQKQSEAEVPAVKQDETKAVQSDNSEEYRIQIGVFRNSPNPEALAKIPAVSSIILEGRGLTKYFAGHFSSKDEALRAIPQVIEAGFSGAFVVYFKQGKLSSLPKE